MVSTLDFESSDPSSNLGRTSSFWKTNVRKFWNPLTKPKLRHGELGNVHGPTEYRLPLLPAVGARWLADASQSWCSSNYKRILADWEHQMRLVHQTNILFVKCEKMNIMCSQADWTVLKVLLYYNIDIDYQQRHHVRQQQDWWLLGCLTNSCFILHITE